jgi:hypothetical protein
MALSAACASTPPGPAEIVSAGEGFLVVDVLGVIPGPEGHALFLVEPLSRRILPIWIGQAEAMSIQLRLDRRRFERPLTHDLVDQLLEHFDARILELRIDAVHDGTFVSTLTLRSPQGRHSLDVRPSDGVALAIGARAPIYVALEVLKNASLSQEALQHGAGPLLPPPPSKSPTPGI